MSRLLLLGCATPVTHPGDEEPKSILVLRPDARLGNLLLITPLVRELRRRYPRSDLFLWTSGRFAPLLGRCQDLDGVLTPSYHLRPGSAAVRGSGLLKVRERNWDLAVSSVLPRATSMSGSLLMAWSRARHRIGFDHPLSRASLTHPVPPPPSAEHAAVELLALVGADAKTDFSPPTLRPLPPASKKTEALLSPAAGRLRILLHTGGRRDKAWSVEAFRRTAVILSRAGHEVWVARGPDAQVWEPSPQSPQNLSGDSPPDGSSSRNTPPLDGNVRFLPAMSATDFAHVLAQMDRFLGCDTGAMHLAAAVGTPVTAIFRTSDPRRYAPVGSHHSVLVLGPRSKAYVAEGGWPSLPRDWAPKIDIAPEPALVEDPVRQVEWVAGKLVESLSKHGVAGTGNGDWNQVPRPEVRDGAAL
jgi:ADP-heptose:LPS heptosyltransferase